jgi:hypothetical protein
MVSGSSNLRLVQRFLGAGSQSSVWRRTTLEQSCAGEKRQAGSFGVVRGGSGFCVPRLVQRGVGRLGSYLYHSMYSSTLPSGSAK